MSKGPKRRRASDNGGQEDAALATDIPQARGPIDPVSRQTMLLVLIAVLVAAYALQWILLPFVVAALLAYICTPPVDWFAARTRTPRVLSVVLMFLILVGIGCLLALLGIPPLMRELTKIATDFEGTIAGFAQAALGDRTISLFGQQMNAAQVTQATVHGVQEWLGQTGRITAFATYTFASIFGVFLTLVLLFYFLLSGAALLRGLFWLMPPRQRPRVRRVWSHLDPVLKRYLIGIVAVVVYAIVAAYIGLALFLGLRHAVVLALLTGILEMIPVVGPGAAAVIVGLVAIHYANGIGPIIAYAIYAAALRLSIDQLFGPIALGTAARLHPTLIIFCFLSGGLLFGITGIILAVPVALTVKVTLATLYNEPPADDRLRGKPGPG